MSTFAGHAGLDGFGGLLLREPLQRGDLVAFADLITLPLGILPEIDHLLEGDVTATFRLLGYLSYHTGEL